jgi:hypothetical protein
MNVIKSSRAISRVSVAPKTNVSETSSVSIIRVSIHFRPEDGVSSTIPALQNYSLELFELGLAVVRGRRNCIIIPNVAPE